jgi:uridine phosphorylase
MMKKKSHDGVDLNKVASHVLVVGDPQRVNDAAEFLENIEPLWDGREYRAINGSYAGKNITICSHGVGASGAAYIFEVLFTGGAKTIIRAGTCGAMVAGVPDGGLIIGTGAIRADGVTAAMVPMEFPAIADRHVVSALERAAANHGYTDLPTGIVITDGLFFPYEYQPSNLDLWPKLGAVAIEMEFAALLIQASIHGARAGGIFTSDGNVVEEPDPWAVDPDRDIVTSGKKIMLKIAIDALAELD